MKTAESSSRQIAVLMTCFNRSESTVGCLDKLFEATLPENTTFEVFLVDDNSPDLTGLKVKERFPQVNIIKGNGNLYWSGGMYRAWEEAVKTKDFDFYLWLNDDTDLYPKALEELLKDDFILQSKSVIVGACQSKKDQTFTYGGYLGETSVIPSGVPQKCEFTNGNIVLIPRHVYSIIGNLNKKYIHLYGDFDYSMRVNKEGLACYTSSEFLATCELNENSYWGADNLSTWQKLKLLHHPKGIDVKRVYYYKKYHFGRTIAFKTLADAYLRTLFPRFHKILKKRKD